MTYLINVLVYEVFYACMYLAPPAIVLKVLSLLEFSIPKEIGLPLGMAVIVVMGVLFLLSGYRAKLAADCRVNNDMKFLQAHRAGGAIARSNLSFLPIIGFLFKSKDQ